MTTLLLDSVPDMAKEKGEPSTVTVRMDAELVRMARIHCTHTAGRGGSSLKLVDYLDSIVRARIVEDYEATMARIVEQQQERPRKKKGGE